MLMKKRRKLTVVVLVSLWLFSFTTSAFTSPSSRTDTYYRHDSVELHAIKLSEEPVIQIGDDIIEQQAFVAPEASQNIVVVDGMPTSTLISAEGAILSTDQELTTATATYRNGLITIGFITLLFASNSPILRSAWESTANAPPVLLVNAAVSIIGLIGVIATSPFLGQIVTDPSSGKAVEDSTNINNEDLAARLLGPSVIAGAELGLWKCLGTTANIYGLSQTSSDHGAFLIQLTTLIVPVAQGIMGVPIPKRIWAAIGLALGGVFIFTQDPNQSDCASLQGDIICACAAVFYATYDLRLFRWGKLVPTNELITTKMVTQSLLSLVLLSVLGRQETINFLSDTSADDLKLVGAVVLWSGLAVNCVAPYLQVSGQQAVGPARAQILYASQPLWAAIMSFFLLREACGIEGITGGILFLCAMFLAATADNPDPNCPAKECEV
jgi:drug/metabolite transporter (DMT)-like permease